MTGSPALGQARVRYFAVWAALQSHPKWMPLSMATRGAWVSLAIVACSSEPRGGFRDRAHAELLLRRDGADNPAGLVTELLDVGLLDEDEDGLRFHDWADWQRKPSDMPDAVAERKRRSRAGHVTPAMRDGHENVTPQKEGGRRASKERSTPDGALSRRALVADRQQIARFLAEYEVAIDDSELDELAGLGRDLRWFYQRLRDKPPDYGVIAWMFDRAGDAPQLAAVQ